MKEKDIQRINELYNLDKSIGLTPEQKEEQRKLRHEYIQSVRANLRAQLNNVSIMAIPGVTSPAVQLALTAHCANTGASFAVLDVLDVPQNLTKPQD